MESILIFGFIFLTTIFWFLAIFNITKTRFKNQKTSTSWLLVVLFFPVLGALFYFQFRKNSVTRQTRKFQPNFKKTKSK